MQKSIFFNILDNFYKKDKLKFYFLFFMSVIAGCFEYLGLVLIFQFVLFLLNPNAYYSIKIINFFNNYFNLQNYSKISLILGTTIALIYIFKNIYMLVFVKINNHILEDLSVKITLKTVKNLIYGDYILIKSIPVSDKLDILNKISIVVWQYCYKYINFVTNLIVAIILLSYLFVKFTLCAFSASIIIAILSAVEYFYLKKCSDYQNKNFSKCLNDISSVLFKIVSSYKEIKLNNLEEYFSKICKSAFQKYASLNKDRCFNNVFHIYFTEISIMLSFIIVLFVLFYTSNFNNQIIISSISTICVVILRLTPVLNRCQSSIYSINSYRKTAEEMLDFNKKFENKIDTTLTKEKLEFKNSITLKNVQFKYAERSFGLENINFEIKKNEFIGIVGKSGCYKTTLALIITGLIKPQSGEILIDEIPLSNYKMWQNNIAILNQDYNLIFDNIYKNIAYSDNCDKSAIDLILNKLNLDEIKNSDNQMLSEGQKQRISLASVLYKDKDIIILDEATSSVDVISEDKINDILKELKGKKTIISIAHRLQILKHCDKIIYINSGMIEDIDTFKNLEEKYPEFKKMIELSNFKSA